MDPFKLRTTRETFFAFYGFGPHECFFCRREVATADVHVHHINENGRCNHPYNLVPAHASCHGTFHYQQKKDRFTTTGYRHTPEARRRMSEAAKGRVIPPETRRKMSEAQRNRRHSEATKAKMRVAALERWERERQRA